MLSALPCRNRKGAESLPTWVSGAASAHSARVFGVGDAQELDQRVPRVGGGEFAPAFKIDGRVERGDGGDARGLAGIAAIALEALEARGGAQHGHQVTAGGAARAADLIRVDAEGFGVGADPAHGGLGIVDGGGVLGFAREAVFDAGAGETARRHVRRLALEGGLAAVDPAASVDVDHGGEGAGAGLGQEEVQVKVAAPAFGVDDVALEFHALGQGEGRVLVLGGSGGRQRQEQYSRAYGHGYHG